MLFKPVYRIAIILLIATSGILSTSAEQKLVKLGDNLAQLNLPNDYRFLEQEKAKEVLKKEGVAPEGVLGIIASPKGSADRFMIVCRFEDSGYVNDDDAEKLNANELLNSMKEGTKEQNEQRKELHVAPFFVGDWAEKPHYDKANHRVIWAIEVKDEDSSTAPVAVINYNTRILGRRGVLSMNLVTDPKDLAQNKGKLAGLLQATTFSKGQSYSEYVPGQDKAAGYGIAGLILGGGALAAAAKFGLFAPLMKWGVALLLVMKKFIVVAVLGIGAFVAKIFKKKPDKTE